MEPVVSVRGLTKCYDVLTAVDDLSFDLARGSVTGFLGPNGAGKTTTLRMLLGLAEPTQGRALVFGRPYAELACPAKRVGAVLEAADLHPGRTARDHLRVLAPLAGVTRGRVGEVLALVDLTGAGDRRVAGFSLGMRQRLALAAALLGDPELLILDEPANGLDPEGVRWLRDFLRAFAAGGRTVFVSSHHLAEVEQLVDDVVIINHGKLVLHAGPRDADIRRPTRGRVPRADSGAGAMTRQLRSEWLKLRTTRLLGIVLLAAVAITVFGALTEGLSRTTGELAKEHAQRTIFNAAGSTVVLVATFAGLLLVTSEFRYGTIRPTLIAEPRRRVLVAAKLAAAALVGLMLAVVCVAASFGTGLATLTARGVDVELSGGHALALALGPLVAAPLGAALGVAIALLIRNQAGAIAALAGYAVFVDALLFAAVPSVARYLPGKAGDALTGRPADDLLLPILGAVVLALWTLAFVVAATIRTARSDV